LNASLERRVSELCDAASLSARAGARLRNSVDERWSDVADDLRGTLSDDETLALAVSVDVRGEHRRGVIVGRPMLRAYSRHVREPEAPRHIPLHSCAAARASMMRAVVVTHTAASSPLHAPWSKRRVLWRRR
jgi:hypothetical protein